MYLDTQDQEGEIKLFRRFFDEYKVGDLYGYCLRLIYRAWCFSLFILQVYLVPGSMFGCKHAGWFRIIFAVGQGRLEEGLDRVERALHKKSSL